MVCSLAVMAEDSIVSMTTDTVAPMERVRKPLITDSMEFAVVKQDSTITRLLDRMVNGSDDEIKQVPGFRVQIFSSNRQQTAKSAALELERQIVAEGGVQVYVQYNPPFWKVRLGNFHTQEEATEYKNEFVKSHPNLQGDTYIVRDMIEVLN